MLYKRTDRQTEFAWCACVCKSFLKSYGITFISFAQLNHKNYNVGTDWSRLQLGKIFENSELSGEWIINRALKITEHEHADVHGALTERVESVYSNRFGLFFFMNIRMNKFALYLFVWINLKDFKAMQDF